MAILLAGSSAHTVAAMAHLLATQAGTGQGTVFASMLSLRIDEPTLSLVQRTKREVADLVDRSSLREEAERDVSVLTTLPRLTLHTSDESLTISEGSAINAVVVRLDEGRMTVKNSDVLEIVNGK